MPENLIGIVKTINGDGITGSIQITVTGGNIEFADPGLASKLIKVNDEVTFIKVTLGTGANIAVNIKKN